MAGEQTREKFEYTSGWKSFSEAMFTGPEAQRIVNTAIRKVHDSAPFFTTTEGKLKSPSQYLEALRDNTALILVQDAIGNHGLMVVMPELRYRTEKEKRQFLPTWVLTLRGRWQQWVSLAGIDQCTRRGGINLSESQQLAKKALNQAGIDQEYSIDPYEALQKLEDMFNESNVRNAKWHTHTPPLIGKELTQGEEQKEQTKQRLQASVRPVDSLPPAHILPYRPAEAGQINVVYAAGAAIIIVAAAAPFVLTGCGEVVSATKTEAPPATIIPKVTETATQIPAMPTKASTPTPEATPTLSHPAYHEGLANYTDESIPVLKRSDIPALIAYLNTLPTHLKSDASFRVSGTVAEQTNGEKVFGVVCAPGSCDVFATIKLDDTEVVNGVTREIQPVVVVWEVKTKDGRGWLLDYAYDSLSEHTLRVGGYDILLKNVSSDGTVQNTVSRVMMIAFAQEDRQYDPYFGSILDQDQSAYKNAIPLINKWYTTGVMDPALWNLLYLGFID